MQAIFEKTLDTEKSNVVQLVQPWTAIVDGLVFWKSSQYEHLDQLLHQQNPSKEKLDALWAVIATYQQYSVDAALLLLKRESFPRCTSLARNLLWSLKRVRTIAGKTHIDPSISSEDLMGFLVWLEKIVAETSYAYASAPRPSARSGRVGGVLFDNVIIPEYYDLEATAERVNPYSQAEPSPVVGVNARRLVHCCSAIYIVLRQIDGVGPEISFVDISEPARGMLVFPSAREDSVDFDYLYTLFLDSISDLGLIPRMTLVDKPKFDGLQAFSATLQQVVADKSPEDWQWLRQHFEKKLALNDPRSLLPLVIAAIDHLSNGVELSPDIIKKADSTSFRMD